MRWNIIGIVWDYYIIGLKCIDGINLRFKQYAIFKQVMKLLTFASVINANDLSIFR